MAPTKNLERDAMSDDYDKSDSGEGDDLLEFEQRDY